MAHDSKKFAKSLESHIKAKGFTKKDFANRFGYTPGGFNHFLKGRVPDGGLLHQFAKALGVSMEELLTGEPPSYLLPDDSARQSAEEGYSPEIQNYVTRLVEVLQGDNEEDKAMLRRAINLAAKNRRSFRSYKFESRNGIQFVVIDHHKFKICNDCNKIDGQRETDCQCDKPPRKKAE